MSNDELEARLRGMPARAPRPGLRADVLSAVHRELRAETGAPSRTATWLERPATWMAAAALLVGLLVGQGVMERSFERRVAHGGAGAAAGAGSARHGMLSYYDCRALILSLVGSESDDV